MKKIFLIIFSLCLLTAGASAQIVGAGDSDGDYRGKPTKGTDSKYADWSKSLGGHLRLEVSMGTLLSAQYTHQLSQYFMVGGGLGWGFRHYVKKNGGRDFSDLTGLPVFAVIETRTGNLGGTGMTLFANIHLGYSIGIGGNASYSYKSSLLFGANVGYSFRDFSLFIGYATNSFMYFNYGLSYDIPLTTSSSTKKKK